MSGDSGDIVRGERFSGGPAREFMSSLAADRRLFAADLAVDRAHVVMLAETGVLSEAQASEVLDALGTVEREGFDALPDGEDVHAAIETAVIDLIGPAGGRMHTARSRNDEVATCLRYRVREDLLDLLDVVLEARHAIASTAADHTGTVMPGYTHLQPAQPTTVAHWLLSYERALARDTERVLDAYDRVNRSPLGAAAFAGTPFPIDRERTATLLGFDGVITNSMDAVSTRDFLLETVAAVAGLAGTLSGIAADGIHLASRGLFEPADAYASTSSIMPQKKNPDSLELVRATAGDAHASLSGLLTTLKGLPRAYNRDLQRATPHAWSALDAVTAATEVIGGAVATAGFDPDALATAAGDGFTTATGVADRLAMAGIPFRTAHEVLARAAEAGGDYDAVAAAVKDVLREPVDAIADPEAIRAALDPAESVAMRDSTGGPAEAAIEDALVEVEESLAEHDRAIEDRLEHVRAAADRLDEEVASRV